MHNKKFKHHLEINNKKKIKDITSKTSTFIT